MKRLLLTLFVGLVATGCVDADQTLKLIGHVPNEGKLQTDENGDSILTDCTAPSFGDGLTIVSRLSIDLADVNDRFDLLAFMVSQLGNSEQLNPIGAGYNHRTNQNNIQIERAVLTFPPESNQAGFPNLDEEYDFTAYIGTGEASIYGNIPLIRPTNIARWKQAVDAATGGKATAIVPGMVQVLIEGSTTAGNSVESSLLSMPFDICDGCGQGTTPACIPK